MLIVDRSNLSHELLSLTYVLTPLSVLGVELLSHDSPA